MEQTQWWGYLHTNGTVQVKIYFTFEDIAEADASPFVEKTTGPFEAVDRATAILIAAKNLYS